MCVPRVGFWDSKYVDEIFHSDWTKIMGQGLLQAWPFGYYIIKVFLRGGEKQSCKKREAWKGCLEKLAFK
jgi:hypothetical protein